MSRKISLRLPETMIDTIDAIGSDQSPFAYLFNGSQKTRSLKLRSVLSYALENPPKSDASPAPAVPTMKPIKPLANGAPVNTENIRSETLTLRHIESLETAELLAHIIGQTTFAKPLDLKRLAGMSVQGLARRFDLNIEDANRLAMLFEFAKRLAVSHADQIKVTSPADIASYLMSKLRYLQHEVVVCLALDTKGNITDNLIISQDANTAESAMGEIIGHRMIFEGTLNATVFHPREIFRYAIDCCANSIVIAHNHPSGDPQPSQEDIRATKQLIEAGNHIGIKVLDHIIIGDGIFVSLKEEGFI